MAQTKAGGQLMKQRMIEKLGSEEAYSEYMAARGRKGGQATGYKGFATDRERARVAGALGGSISRRGKAKKVDA